MEERLQQLHIKAGRFYGQESTCGKKVDYKSYLSACKAADSMNKKSAKPLEAYPCAFCSGWHIGRQMSREELESFS